MSIPLEGDPIVRIGQTMRGDPYKYEVDIVAECGNVLVLVECKDHERLSPSQGVYAIHGLLRVAKAHPEREVHAIIVSSSDPPGAVGEEIRNGLMALSPNVVGSVRLAVVPTEVVGPWIVAHEPLDPALPLYAMRLPAVDRAEDLSKLVEVGLHLPAFHERLEAASAIVAHPGRTPELEVRALREMASAFVHAGAFASAHAAIGRVRRLSARHDDLCAVAVHDTMASFGAALRTGAAQRPGLTSVKALERGLANLDPINQGSAATFLAAWHRNFGSRDVADAWLEMSRRIAIEAGDEHGAYIDFLRHLRSIEGDPKESKNLILPSLHALLPDLGQTHLEIAMSLIDRIVRGEDTSIRITVHEPFRGSPR